MGEGTIYLTPTKKIYKNKIYYGITPTIGVSNTDMAIIDFCLAFLSNFKVYETEYPSKGVKKKSWSLRISRQKQILETLHLIRPYLIGDKARLADLMIEFCSRPKTKRYEGRDLEIYHQIRNLNGRGKRGNKIYEAFLAYLSSRR